MARSSKAAADAGTPLVKADEAASRSRSTTHASPLLSASNK